MKGFLFLPCCMQDPIQSVPESQDPQQSCSKNGSLRNGVGPGERWALSWALSALIKTTTRWWCRLSEGGNTPSPAQKQSPRTHQARNIPALKSTLSGQKRLADHPLPSAYSFLHHIQRATRAPLPNRAFHSRRVKLLTNLETSGQNRAHGSAS